MCIAVYLASDVPLPLVQWDEAAPAFYVADATGPDAVANFHFPGAHVYYLGAHTGCGCGFQCHYDDDEDDRAAKHRSTSRLASYLEEAMARPASLRLFACWEGDQNAPPDHARRLSPALIRQPDFSFLERELSVVVPDDVAR